MTTESLAKAKAEPESHADPPVASPIGLFEMVLEVTDLEAAERFYRERGYLK